MKGFVTTSEAAKRLGVTAGRVRQMILEGTIKKVEKIGRDNFIPESEIKRLEQTDRPAGRPLKEKK